MAKDLVTGDTYRETVKRLTKEKEQLMSRYREAVLYMFVSAFLNVALLAAWIFL